MICGRVAFEVDEIASSSSSHSPEELISKSFDYVLAEGKTPACSSPDNCGHTINNWVESRWHNLQAVISVRALEHLGEFHREPPHPNRSYKHICGYLRHLLFNWYRVSQISPPFRIYCWHGVFFVCLYPSWVQASMQQDGPTPNLVA